METHFENMESAQTARARERVIEDLKSLVRDSEELIKATAGDVSDKAKEARARLNAALQRAKGSCEDLQKQTAEAARKADAVIRAHPYESLGVALGVGLLIGVLLSRK